MWLFLSRATWGRALHYLIVKCGTCKAVVSQGFDSSSIQHQNEEVIVQDIEQLVECSALGVELDAIGQYHRPHECLFHVNDKLSVVCKLMVHFRESLPWTWSHVARQSIEYENFLGGKANCPLIIWVSMNPQDSTNE